MTFVRFAPGERRADSPHPLWLRFVWAVNEARPGTFGAPEHEPDRPRAGYVTERYPTARVIHGPGEDGVRVVADDEDTLAAFRVAAGQLGLHLTPPSGPVAGQ